MKRIHLIAALLFMSAGVCMAQKSLWDRRPDGAVRIATYNVGIFDKYPDSDYKVAARLMKELDPDVLVLNEIDSCTVRTGHVDQLGSFVKRMGMNWQGVFAPALNSFQSGAYGIAEAWDSRRKDFVRSFNVSLPKGEGTEPRALVVVEYEDMVVAGTHLEHTSHAAREGQISVITDTLKTLYADSGKHVFLCGDMNASPESETLMLLRKDWTVLSAQKTTYPRGIEIKNMPELPETADDTPGSCIDYIMILNNGAEYEVTAADVCVRFRNGTAFSASDHLPVYIDVILK